MPKPIGLKVTTYPMTGRQIPMAKVTLTPYEKDDPIFSTGLQFFKPASMPSTGGSPRSTDGEAQSEMSDAIQSLQNNLQEIYKRRGLSPEKESTTPQPKEEASPPDTLEQDTKGQNSQE